LFILKLKNLWSKFKLFLALRKTEKEFNKEVDENINLRYSKSDVELLQEETQQKYYNGIALMKSRLRDQIKNSDPKSVMNQFKGEDNFYINGDLLSLATDEDEQRKKLRQMKESIYVYDDQDIKTEEDKKKMIDQRIGHYQKLHDAKIKRDLLRKARQAYNAGNLDLHKQLMEEWTNKYGN